MTNHGGRSGVIARFLGKAFITFGFILGTYGLTEGSEAIKQTALGLLVTGVLASAYGMYHWARYHSHPPTPGDTTRCNHEQRVPRRAPSRGMTADQDRSSKP